MEHLWAILERAMPAIGTALGAFLTWAAAQLALYLRRQTLNAKAKGILIRASEVVLQVVLELEQTMVAEVRAALDPASDGGRKITGKEAERIKAEALARVKSYLGPKGLALLAHVLGFNGGNLDRYLEGKIEATVHAAKLGGKINPEEVSALASMPPSLRGGER